MTEIQKDVASADAETVRARNNRKLGIIAAGSVLAAAVIVGIFLIPRPDIIENQLDREQAQANAAGTPPTVKVEGGADGQVLAGANGTTFIVGNAGPIVGLDTSLADLSNAREPGGFPGTILIRNAEVQLVPGDKVFAIGNTPAESILVMIEEPTNPGNLGEHDLVIRKGQMVSVSGTVQELRDSSLWGVTGKEAGKLGNMNICLKAKTVQIMR